MSQEVCSFTIGSLGLPSGHNARAALFYMKPIFHREKWKNILILELLFWALLMIKFKRGFVLGGKPSFSRGGEGKLLTVQSHIEWNSTILRTGEMDCKNIALLSNGYGDFPWDLKPGCASSNCLVWNPLKGWDSGAGSLSTPLGTWRRWSPNVSQVFYHLLGLQW